MSFTPAEIYQLAEAVADLVAARLGTGADEVGDSHAAAQWLGVSVPTLERAVRRGEVPSIKVGRLRRFRRSDLLGLKAKRGCDD